MSTNKPDNLVDIFQPVVYPGHHNDENDSDPAMNTQYQNTQEYLEIESTMENFLNNCNNAGSTSKPPSHFIEKFDGNC